jgi:hypothetical protein
MHNLTKFLIDPKMRLSKYNFDKSSYFFDETTYFFDKKMLIDFNFKTAKIHTYCLIFGYLSYFFIV